MNNGLRNFWKDKSFLGAGILVIFFFPALLAAESITGVVRNQSQGRPAVGDEVILLGAGQEAREEARTRTDSLGAFTLELFDPGKPHMLRVIHQGVNYDRKVAAGGGISIDVADAAAEVKGITGGIEIIRAGSQAKMLHVSEMIEIKNLSNPPLTQASERGFEVYLPVDAKIDSVLAAGPENIGATITATLVRGEPGHYTVNFPLRPGSSKFAFNFDLPYDGRALFQTRNMVPLQQLAVMIPPTMRFTSKSPAFQILPVGNDKYIVEAAEELKAGAGPEFEISGEGELASLQGEVHAPPKPLAGALAAPALAKPDSFEAQAQGANSLRTMSLSDRAAPASRPQGWVLGAGAVLMLGSLGLLAWCGKRVTSRPAPYPMQSSGEAGQGPESLLEALKEGLFQLESDRLQGAIPREEYAAAKQALEGTIQWALARSMACGRSPRQQLHSDI